MLESGDRVGDWIVESQLGEGGMGAVYRCHSVLSDAMKAALKVMKSHALGAGRERFAQELQSLAMLSHPGIVRVLGGGEDRERGLLFLVMELLSGESLADRIRRGPLPATEAVPLFRSVADSLAYAQSAGIHHRDVKPENIMLVAGAGPKLIDFGIAKASGGAQLTVAGAVPGTMAYLAPEQFTADDPDPALADIYSLGLTLHEALTGQCAYASSTTSGAEFGRLVGRKLDSKPMDPGTAFAAPLRELVRKATEPDPKRRFASMSELAAGLGALAVDPLSQPWGARPASHGLPPQTVAVRREPVAPVRLEAAPAAVVAAPGNGGKRWLAAGAVGLVGGGLALTAVVGIALAAFFAWPDGTVADAGRVLEIAAPPDAVVRVGDERIDVVNGTATTTRPTGAVDVRIARGPGAETWTGGACPACASCAEERVDLVAGEGARAVALPLAELPAAIRTVRASAPGLPTELRPTFRLDGREPSSSEPGAAAFDGVTAGDHVLTARVGTCPSSDRCASDGSCPPACSAVSQPVVVGCGPGPQAVTVTLSAPGAAPVPVVPQVPVKPAPGRPAPVPIVEAPVPEPPAPEVLPEPEPEPEPAPASVPLRTVRIIAPGSTTGLLVRDGTGEVQQVVTNQTVQVRVGDVQVQHGFSGASVIVNVGLDSQRIVCATPDSCVVK